MILLESSLGLTDLYGWILRQAQILVDAKYCALVIYGNDKVDSTEGFEPMDPISTSISWQAEPYFMAFGFTDLELRAMARDPEASEILGIFKNRRQPLRLPSAKDQPKASFLPSDHPSLDNLLGVPIVVRERPFGGLFVGSKQDGSLFDDEDEAMFSAFSLAAGFTILSAKISGLHSDLSVFQERDRIARDLHDSVIQRLFAAGMALERVRSHEPVQRDQEISRFGGSEQSIHEPVQRDQVIGTAKELDSSEILASVARNLDETIGEIRRVIFSLDTMKSARLLSAEVRSMVSDIAQLVGCVPSVTCDPSIDDAREPIRENILLALREALSNVARHSLAKNVEVNISARDGQFVLTVTDDGIGAGFLNKAGTSGRAKTSGTGPGPLVVMSTGHGIENMSTRAQELGGEFSVSIRPTGGTIVRWSVPSD